MREYDYLKFPFAMPGTNDYRRASYYNECPECRMRAQFEYNQRHMEMYRPLVGFRTVDVKELVE